MNLSEMSTADASFMALGVVGLIISGLAIPTGLFWALRFLWQVIFKK